MCSAATCRRCGKTTWAGCGQHVKQVMAGVPAKQRCTCEADKARAASEAAEVKTGRRAARQQAGGGLLRTLFRR